MKTTFPTIVFCVMFQLLSAQESHEIPTIQNSKSEVWVVYNNPGIVTVEIADSSFVLNQYDSKILELQTDSLYPIKIFIDGKGLILDNKVTFSNCLSFLYINYNLVEWQSYIALEITFRANRTVKDRISKEIEDSMIKIEGGSFLMGCTTEQNNCNKDEFPVHNVSIHPFYLNKFEITRRQWYILVGAVVDYSCCNYCPMNWISYYDAVDFCDTLSRITGHAYRLPTEAEWEYAARGGHLSDSTHATQYAGSNTINEVAWYYDNSNNQPRIVGQKTPNALGLFDMSGNVFEWCSDYYDAIYYNYSPLINPSGCSDESFRVIRGGSWVSDSESCRLANREFKASFMAAGRIGFRIAREDD